MTTDVHAHCVPLGMLERLETEGGRYGIEVTRQDGRYAALIAGRVQTRPVFPALMDLPRRLAAMDAAGVDVQVLSSWIDLTAYALPAAQGARYARMFNEAMAETVAAAPGRLRGLATVPLQTPGPAAEELRHAVTALGLVGAEIATAVDGTDLDDPELDPFWTAAEELQALVLIHPYASLAGRGVTRFNLNNTVGNPAETTVAVGHLVFGGVLERHPGLRIALVHGGGFVPYQLGRWDHAFHTDDRGAATHLTRPPSEWVRRMLFDTVVHSPGALRFLVDVVGAEQVVLGSDYPFRMGDPTPVATVDAVPGLGEADRERILGGTLDALLGAVGRH